MAANKNLLPLFLLLNVLLSIMAGKALAARPNFISDPDMKQPEWLIQPDGSVLIPGIGRILVPMPGGGSGLYIGGIGGSGGDSYSGGSGSGSLGGAGGDDTLPSGGGFGMTPPSAP